MSKGESSITILLQALKFAAEKHSDQRRKNAAETPYINHPIAVAETWWTVGRGRKVTTLVAAILHDTLEDTKTVPEELERLFGKEIMSLVLEVSDDNGLPRQERKQQQVARAPYLSLAAKEIKLADKIVNVSDLVMSPPAQWSLRQQKEYVDWAEAVVAGLRGCNGHLEDRFDQVLREAKNYLEEERIAECSFDPIP